MWLWRSDAEALIELGMHAKNPMTVIFLLFRARCLCSWQLAMVWLVCYHYSHGRLRVHRPHQKGITKSCQSFIMVGAASHDSRSEGPHGESRLARGGEMIPSARMIGSFPSLPNWAVSVIQSCMFRYTAAGGGETTCSDGERKNGRSNAI